jgi:hypothetical protein
MMYRGVFLQHRWSHSISILLRHFLHPSPVDPTSPRSPPRPIHTMRHNNVTLPGALPRSPLILPPLLALLLYQAPRVRTLPYWTAPFPHRTRILPPYHRSFSPHHSTNSPPQPRPTTSTLSHAPPTHLHPTKAPRHAVSTAPLLHSILTPAPPSRTPIPKRNVILRIAPIHSLRVSPAARFCALPHSQTPPCSRLSSSPSGAKRSARLPRQSRRRHSVDSIRPLPHMRQPLIPRSQPPTPLVRPDRLPAHLKLTTCYHP